MSEQTSLFDFDRTPQETIEKIQQEAQEVLRE